MNDEIIDDLKQFISATVLQSTAEIREDIAELRTDVSQLKADVTELKVGLRDTNEKLDTVIEATGDQFDDHERRITKLEARAA